MCDRYPGSCLIDGRHEGGHDFDDLIDPCVAFTCPNCQRDLAPYEVSKGRYSCECGAIVTVTEPVPGLVMTRQDAVVKP